MTHAPIVFDLKSDKDLESLLKSDEFLEHFHVLRNCKLLAYVIESQENNRFLGTAFYLDEKICEVSIIKDGLLQEGSEKLKEKPDVDMMAQYLQFVETSVVGFYGKQYYSPIKIHLASWVKDHLLEKYDIKCQAQLKNAGRLGDSQSLFAGGDACERIQKLIEKES